MEKGKASGIDLDGIGYSLVISYQLSADWLAS